MGVVIEAKKVLGCVYFANCNILENFRLKLGACVVVYNAGTHTSNFEFKYHRENEEVRETVLACYSMGPRYCRVS